MRRKPKGKTLIQANFNAGFSSQFGWSTFIDDNGWLRQSIYPYEKASTRDVHIGDDAVLQLLMFLEEKQFMQERKSLSSIYEGFSDPRGYRIVVLWDAFEHITVAFSREDTPKHDNFFEVWDAIHKYAPVSDT
jgi:hypothetical protein